MSSTKLWAPTEPPNIDIDLSAVPAVEMKLFCLAVAEAAERYFADPVHRVEFEEWLKREEANAS